MSCVGPIYHFLWLCARCLCCVYPSRRTRHPIARPRAHLPPVRVTPGARVPLHLVTTRRLWDAFGTTESFLSAVFCFAQLVYIIITTYKSMRTCAARVYPASGPFWARDGRYSISSAVTAGDDEASPGRVWDHKKLWTLGFLLWPASLYHVHWISTEMKLLVRSLKRIQSLVTSLMLLFYTVRSRLPAHEPRDISTSHCCAGPLG